MRHIFRSIPVVIFIALLLATVSSAEVPHLIRFQGKVTEKAGAPLDGQYDLTFRIYNGETGGSLMWSETQMDVPVNNGVFTALLGNVNPVDLPFNEPYWLSVEVNDDGEMEPRQSITSVGYAIHAEVADSIANVAVIPTGAIILWMGESCPEGYSRVTTMDGKFLVSGTGYNPAAGGSNVASGSTDAHVLSVAEMPAHTHDYDYGINAAGGGIPHILRPMNHVKAGTDQVKSKGGGQGHSHTISSIDNRPEFATVILCEKD